MEVMEIQMEAMVTLMEEMEVCIAIYQECESRCSLIHTRYSNKFLIQVKKLKVYAELLEEEQLVIYVRYHSFIRAGNTMDVP